MSESAFDPDDFLNQSSNDALDTKYVPIPQGEYTAVIDNVELRQIETKRGSTLIADVIWAIDDPQLSATLGRDKLTVKQGLFLDTITGPNGKPALDFGKGKNVALGKIRDAVGQNVAGQAWNIGLLKGAGPAKIKVIQKPDPNSDDVFANVKSVGRMA